MTRFDISNIVYNLQEAATARYGSGNGHAWSSGYLGSLFADALYNHVPESERDNILRAISDHTNKMNAETARRTAA